MRSGAFSQQYKLSNPELIQVIDEAIHNIDLSSPEDQITQGQYHHLLSQRWVESLAGSLERFYQEKTGDKKISALYRTRDTSSQHTPDRGEYLFDITLAEHDSFVSSHQQQTIHFITEPVWQIESEFAQNMRDMAEDFQKLIAGSAPYKMMVGPMGQHESQSYRDDMAHLSQYICADALYFLFLPHPSTWTARTPHARVRFEWVNTTWKERAR